MRAGRPSTTARVSAFLRALHQSEPAGRRISDDPDAALMVERRLGKRAARSGSLAARRRLRLAAEEIAARDRFADDWAARTIRGRGQIVLLGAGLDTMTLRLQERFPEARFFEVDAPATQERKLSLLARSGRQPPADRCRFVPADFETDDVGGNLIDAGFDPQVVTFVNWMGVTYYLQLDVIDHTIQALSRLLCAGSVVALDYFDESGPHMHSLHGYLWRLLGEPIRSWLSREDLQALAACHGMVVAEQTTPLEVIADRLGRAVDVRTPLQLAALIRS